MPGLWKPGHSLVNTKVPVVCHGGLEFRDLGDQHHWGHHPLQLQLDPTLPTSVRGWGPHAKLEESRGKEHIPKTMPLERWDALRCEGFVEHMCLHPHPRLVVCVPCWLIGNFTIDLTGLWLSCRKSKGDMVQTSDLSGSHLANLSTWALLEPQWLALCTAKVTPLEWFEV